jgi:pantoate--beta-alanine ligase
MAGSALKLHRTASQLRETIAGWRAVRDTIALVPTMGNLHAGHASLAELAAEHADRVVMTIFVNPTQFGVGEDFEAYPRTLAEDRELVESTGTVDVLFAPDVTEIYPFGTERGYRLKVPDLGDDLCGASRPGHFDGVASVVLRLLNIAMPDLVVLGKKDYQQLILIERMIADLRLPIGVVAGETKREEDGLAISSRNHYLTVEQRRRAPILHATLRQLGERLAHGDKDYAALEHAAIEQLVAQGFEPDYVSVRCAGDLGRPNGRHAPNDLIVLAAAWLGKARLIDNLRVAE